MSDPNNRPKTTHALKHNQRVRLMRSTRKVEALLGETPLFVDSNSPRNSLIQASDTRRAVYIIPATPRSSSLGVYIPGDAGSYASTSRTPHDHHSRPLLAVRVPSTTSEPLDAPPDSAASQLSFSTTIPYLDADEEHRQRKRKMARIVRTLGTQVPAELVFPPGQSRLAKRRSKQRLLRPPSGQGGPSRQHEIIPEDDLDPTSQADAESESSASEYSTLSGGKWVQVPDRPSPSDAEEPPVGFVWGTTHRSEKGWSGEWVAAGSGGSGMQSMDDVAKKLRDLRLR